MEPKQNNPELRRDNLVKELDYSISTLQRYRHTKICEILTNQVDPKKLKDLSWPQLTSKDLTRLNSLNLFLLKLVALLLTDVN